MEQARKQTCTFWNSMGTSKQGSKGTSGVLLAGVPPQLAHLTALEAGLSAKRLAYTQVHARACTYRHTCT